jgi:hypothetical protein
MKKLVVASSDHLFVLLSSFRLVNESVMLMNPGIC